MEIMKLSTAELVASNKRERISGGVYITFISMDNMKVGDYLRIGISKLKRSYYFEVVGSEVTGDLLKITAKEAGYWASRLDHTGVDLRDIINAEIIPIVEDEQIKQIRKESCWC